ncbi:MAG: hypothetical protein AB2L24_22205 [Mangrovibacterium sp.]
MNSNQLKKRLVLLSFFILIAGVNMGKAKEIGQGKNGVVSILEQKEEKVFVIHAPIRDLAKFRKLAEQAVRLKPFGRVEVDVSNLADKGFYEIPEGRNFWYEYASYNPTPYKFFPDPKIAPFIPANFVKKKTGNYYWKKRRYCANLDWMRLFGAMNLILSLKDSLKGIRRCLDQELIIPDGEIIRRLLPVSV